MHATRTIAADIPVAQGFSTCGPRTPGGPRGVSKGSAGNPRKTGDPSHLTKQKYRPYQSCRCRLQRTLMKTSLVFSMLCLKSELD